MKRFHEQGQNKSIIRSIIPGERLRLREGVLGHVQPRQWIFERIENNDTILLVDESGGFGWSVEPHGQSPWHLTNPSRGATSRPKVGAFIHGQRPWLSAAGVKIDHIDWDAYKEQRGKRPSRQN